MRNSRVIEILKGLNSGELRRFGDFINSPYHNKNKHIVLMYTFFKKYSPGFNSLSFTNEDIHKYIYPKEKFNKQRIDQLISDFKSLLEKFIIMEESRKDVIQQKNILLKAFRDRNIVKNFEHTFNEIIKYQNSNYSRTPEYYFNQLKAEFELCSSKMVQIVHSREGGFQKLADDIDLFFVSFKLYVFVLMFQHIKEVQIDINYNLWLKDEIFSYIEKNINGIKKEHPVIYSYYLILMMLINADSEKYFEELKMYLKKNEGKFSQEVLKEIYIGMRNYFEDKISVNRLKYTKELFRIYELLDKKSMFGKDKFIGDVDFLNPIVIALELDRTGWANSFYFRYKNKIKKELRNDTLSLARSQLYFHEGEYQKSLNELKYIKPKTFYFYLRMKVMLIKIYYEMNELEAVLYVVDSLRHYIKRKKELIIEHYDVIANFLHYITKIINIKDSKSTGDISKLKTEIRNDNLVAAKFWMLEKIEELEK